MRPVPALQRRAAHKQRKAAAVAKDAAKFKDGNGKQRAFAARAASILSH